MLVRCKKRDFEVYTEQEAINLNIKYRLDWRNAEIGNWVLSDDGKVLQIRGRRTENRKRVKKQAVYITTGYGQIPTSYGKLFARPVPGKKTEFKLNVRATTKQKDFVGDLAITGEIGPSGTFTSKSVINSYRSVYEDNNDDQALVRGRSILKRKWVQQVMSDTMKKEFDKLKWDDTKVAKQYLEMYDSKDVPATVKKQILDRISHLRGHDVVETQGKEGGAEMDFFITAGEKQLMLPLRKVLAFWKGWMAQGKPLDAEFFDILQKEAGEDIKQLKEIKEEKK